MRGLQARRQYFELSQNLDNQDDFLANTERTKHIGSWAAEQLGLSPEDKLSYVTECLGEVVRENAVLQMLKKIERDLFEANIDSSSEAIYDKFYNKDNP